MYKDMKTEEIKRKYLVKLAGSMGSIYDFSNVHLYDDHEIEEKCNYYGEPFKKIRYSGYDDRINFHKWNVLSDKGHHMMWVLSTSEQHPYLSEWSVMEEGM
jgi:hypothetical protein